MTRSPLRRTDGWFSLPFIAALALLAPAQASAPPQAAAGTESSVKVLTRAVTAVVGIQMQATDGARSAEALGERRSGSGVVIDEDGLILTIGYLLLEADSIQVTTHDQRTLPARLVAYDLATGFGLLRPLLPLKDVPPVVLGRAAQSEPGDALMVAAGGTDGGVAVTQLVSLRPFSGYWEYHIDLALFTSPPVAQHSGAALFNARGELLGIGSLFTTDALGEQRRAPGNMFVPVDLLRPVLAQLQQNGMSRQSRRPWLGVTSSEQDGRVQVVRVSKDSPAEQAGLQPGDVVLAVDGQSVASLEAFYKRLWDRPVPQAEVRLTVGRGDETREIPVQAIDRMDTLRRPAGI